MSVIHLGVVKARSRLDDRRRPGAEMAISMRGNNSATSKCTIRRRRTIDAPTCYQPDYGKCRVEAFGSHPRPAHTLLTISQLAWRGMIVEIDVTAIVPLK
jgi:hypothetical protein